MVNGLLGLGNTYATWPVSDGKDERAKAGIRVLNQMSKNATNESLYNAVTGKYYADTPNQDVFLKSNGALSPMATKRHAEAIEGMRKQGYTEQQIADFQYLCATLP